MIEYKFKQKPSNNEKNRLLLRFLKENNIMYPFLNEGNKYQGTSFCYLSYCANIIGKIDAEIFQRTSTFCSWSETDNGYDFWFEISLMWRLVYLNNIWEWLESNERYNQLCEIKDRFNNYYIDWDKEHFKNFFKENVSLNVLNYIKEYKSKFQTFYDILNQTL